MGLYTKAVIDENGECYIGIYEHGDPRMPLHVLKHSDARFLKQTLDKSLEVKCNLRTGHGTTVATLEYNDPDF